MSHTAKAQAYPTRPITIVVPYPAGGPTDTLAQTPEALAAQQKAEIEKWWPILKAANIKGE
jgi:tripartite-type tricarboxylate transporter receptor subunit TctC